MRAPRGQAQANCRIGPRRVSRENRSDSRVIQRVLNSKNFLAILLSMTTGTLLYFKLPWPVTSSRIPHTWNEYFLRMVAIRDPWSYAALKASYHVMLFTTPYIGYSFLLSAV